MKDRQNELSAKLEQSQGQWLGINERTQKLREAVTKYSAENQKLETNCIMRKRQLQELQKRFRNFIADYNYN